MYISRYLPNIVYISLELFKKISLKGGQQSLQVKTEPDPIIFSNTQTMPGLKMKTHPVSHVSFPTLSYLQIQIHAWQEEDIPEELVD